MLKALRRSAMPVALIPVSLLVSCTRPKEYVSNFNLYFYNYTTASLYLNGPASAGVDYAPQFACKEIPPGNDGAGPFKWTPSYAGATAEYAFSISNSCTDASKNTVTMLFAVVSWTPENSCVDKGGAWPNKQWVNTVGSNTCVYWNQAQNRQATVEPGSEPDGLPKIMVREVK